MVVDGLGRFLQEVQEESDRVSLFMRNSIYGRPTFSCQLIAGGNAVCYIRPFYGNVSEPSF